MNTLQQRKNKHPQKTKDNSMKVARISSKLNISAYYNRTWV